LCAIVLSVILGAAVALAGLSRRPALRRVNRVYVELFRAIPLLVLLLWVFYGLPVIIGLQLGVFATGVLSLALSDSAFEAEVFRAGIQSVPKGQIEAAKSLGLSWYQQMRLVVMPQAIKVILPALGNQFVYVLKMSSLVSVIGLQELTRRANELNVNEYRPLEIYTLLVGEYLLLILVVSYLVRRLERRLANAN
jgi:polar amino acid transport system permease protein